MSRPYRVYQNGQIHYPLDNIVSQVDMGPRFRDEGFLTSTGETLENFALVEEGYKDYQYPYPSIVGVAWLPFPQNLKVQHLVPYELARAEGHRLIRNPLKHGDYHYLPLFVYEDVCGVGRRIVRGHRPEGC